MTFEALETPSNNQIIHAIESNLIAKVKHYPSLLPGMFVIENQKITQINSNEQTSTFNIICNAKFPETVDREEVRSIGEYYRSKQLPVCWWVGPSTTPNNMSDLLKEDGWTYEATDLGLAANVRTIQVHSEPLRGIDIERVQNLDGIMDFASVFASFFGESERLAILNFYEKVGQRGFCDRDPLQNFVVYSDGQPVATSSFFVSHGVAGFYDCLTIPEMRRKGIGLAMMMKRFQLVLDMGVPWVTLSSSYDSRRLYQRLGFKKYCEFSTFVR